MKFRYLKIDLRRNTTYNCHAAEPHKIDFEWLAKNSGNLFNSDVNVSERSMMLRNERNPSCEQNCWAAEDRGAVSPRMFQGGSTVTHTTIKTTPEIVNLDINSDCNLTCSYCCKEFSSAWQRDLMNKGDYQIHGVDDFRYKVVDQDRLLYKLSQNELHNLSRYKMLLDELTSYKSTLKKIEVTGGEPLLDNHLIQLLTKLDLNDNCEIVVYTGMGLSESRFEKVIQQLSRIKNITIKVSAENIGKFLEFNRYGINWPEFQNKIEILNRHISWHFHSTITNLTVFGFCDFANRFQDKHIDLTFAYQPRFMSPFVLDETSKQQVLQQIKTLRPDFQDQIANSIKDTPTEDERLAVKDFVESFVGRRPDLSVDIFPESFLQWIECKHHVVQ